jgi:competence protein ComEC
MLVRAGYVWLRPPLAKCVVGFILGTILFAVNISAVLAVLMVLLLVFPPRKYFLLFIFLAVGVMFTHTREQYVADQITVLTKESSVEISGMVLEVNAKQYTQEAVLETETLPFWILVKLPKYPVATVGEKILVKGKPELPTSTADFDYKAYLNAKGIQLILGSSAYTLLTNTFNLYRIGSALKIALNSVLAHALPEPSASFLSGLILGAGDSQSKEIKADFAEVGLAHVLAASGYNLVIWLDLCLHLAGRINRKYLYLVNLGIGVVFLFVVGITNIAALRAVIMTALATVGKFLGRPVSALTLLVYTAGLLLLFNPLVWQNLSFQLSILAMLGLFCFSDSLNLFFVRYLPKIVAEGMASTLAVLLTTLPLTYAIFGETSSLTLVANVLVVPIVPVVMEMGLTGLAVSQVLPALANGIFWLTWLILSIVMKFVSFLRGLSVDNISSVEGVVGIYFLLVIMYLLADYQQGKRTKKI